MHSPLLPLLALTALISLPASAKAPQPISELLYVGPVDTLGVTVDSNVDATVLASSKALRRAPSEAFLVARKFYPAFGEAVSNAARKVEVIDSSAASTTADPDSSRYVLMLKSLKFTQSSTSVPRRFVAPTAPAFDPATGTMNPGNRKGYAEGPGLVTTLTAHAEWVIWDNTAGVNGQPRAAARGTATGEAAYRGTAGKSQWEETARELAKAILKQTAFSPF